MTTDRLGMDRSRLAQHRPALVGDFHTNLAVARGAREKTTLHHPRDLMRDTTLFPPERRQQFLLRQGAAAQVNQAREDAELRARDPTRRDQVATDVGDDGLADVL